jgi:hypothetical protein
MSLKFAQNWPKITLKLGKNWQKTGPKAQNRPKQKTPIKSG